MICIQIASSSWRSLVMHVPSRRSTSSVYFCGGKLDRMLHKWKTGYANRWQKQTSVDSTIGRAWWPKSSALRRTEWCHKRTQAKQSLRYQLCVEVNVICILSINCVQKSKYFVLFTCLICWNWFGKQDVSALL